MGAQIHRAGEPARPRLFQCFGLCRAKLPDERLDAHEQARRDRDQNRRHRECRDRGSYLPVCHSRRLLPSLADCRRFNLQMPIEPPHEEMLPSLALVKMMKVDAKWMKVDGQRLVIAKAVITLCSQPIN